MVTPGTVQHFEDLVAELTVTLGELHPQTLTSRMNLGYWLGESGDPRGAAKLFNTLARDCARVMGPQHPVTLGAESKSGLVDCTMRSTAQRRPPIREVGRRMRRHSGGRPLNHTHVQAKFGNPSVPNVWRWLTPVSTLSGGLSALDRRRRPDRPHRGPCVIPPHLGADINASRTEGAAQWEGRNRSGPRSKTRARTPASRLAES